MRKVFFVVNQLSEFTFQLYLQKYLYNVEVAVGTEVPMMPYEYSMVILWSCKKIITPNSDYRNYIVFHSSDLSKGRGGAPIYYSFSNSQDYYVISGIFADQRMDSGDVVVKARFKMKDNYVASVVREWDNEISILLIKLLLDKYPDDKIVGVKQTGADSYMKRRKPEDSEIDVNERLVDLLPHIRGCEKKYPAFFRQGDEMFNIFVEPVSKLKFPDDIEILFPECGGGTYKRLQYETHDPPGEGVMHLSFVDNTPQSNFAKQFSNLTHFKQNRFHPLVWINGEPIIGNNVYIGGMSEINAKGVSVIIEDNCDIASFVSINAADSHKCCIDIADKVERKSIHLEKNVFVGSHSVIKGGVHIGHHSVVAAGTVVDACDVPPYSLIIGNPMVVKEGYYDLSQQTNV